MNKIIPIKDLRKTNEISKLCHDEQAPIFVSKNGYDDLVIMSNDVFSRLDKGQLPPPPPPHQNKVKHITPLAQDKIIGFIKVAAINFEVSINNVNANVNQIIELVKKATLNNAKIIVFPELSMSGYTCGDLFFHDSLLKSVEEGLEVLTSSLKDNDRFILVGAPLRNNGKLYNCAIALNKGKILGVIPKTYIPNYGEFYEKRYFEPAGKENSTIFINGQEYPFGNKLIFQNQYYLNETIGVEICEDLWTCLSPSSFHALGGANIECNLSSSNETLSKEVIRRELVVNQARKNNQAYIYSCSSYSESTTDILYSGHNIIAEPDGILNESELFKESIIYSDIDIDRIISHRIVNNSQSQVPLHDYIFIPFQTHLDDVNLSRVYQKYPFIDSSEDKMVEKVKKIISMQGYALARRLKHIHCSHVVLGLSGGLDSTIALFGIVEAFKILNLDNQNIHTITMPCFGTSARTKTNAIKLANYFHCDLQEIDISSAVEQHFKDINFDKENHSVAFENAQARERTQVLMDYANKVNGIVIGTGDLSEIALGWSTYNGDQMSMYGINASLPKTLIREMTRILGQIHTPIQDVLLDILGTPISPELIPPKEGEISQLTEDLIGPYELHDFYLYHFVYHHMDVKKLYFIALETFQDEYKKETIKKWLVNFIKRFFSNQFKRSCSPDGVKITEVSLSPRGDLRLPSDGSYQDILNQLNELE